MIPPPNSHCVYWSRRSLKNYNQCCTGPLHPWRCLLRHTSLNGSFDPLLPCPGVFAQPKMAGYLPRCPMVVSIRPPLTRGSALEGAATPCKHLFLIKAGGVAQMLLSFNGLIKMITFISSRGSLPGYRGGSQSPIILSLELELNE